MATQKWAIDPTHSELGFKVRHLMISNVAGTFKQFDVKAESENDDFSKGNVEVTAEIASVFTNNEQRDQHLRTSDFFEADKHPQLHFKSKGFEKKSAGEFVLSGDLTMKGITKPVQLNVEFNGIAKDPWGNTKAGFVVSGKINRHDWDLNWNAALEAGGFMLGEEIKIQSEIQLVKQA